MLIKESNINIKGYNTRKAERVTRHKNMGLIRQKGGGRKKMEDTEWRHTTEKREDQS